MKKPLQEKAVAKKTIKKADYKYHVSNSEKGQCFEREVWSKGKKSIAPVSYYSWAFFVVTTTDDNPPEGLTELEDDDEVDMYALCGGNIKESELEELTNNSGIELEFENVSKREQNKISEMNDMLEYSDSLLAKGWKYNTYLWITGPLKIKPVK